MYNTKEFNSMKEYSTAFKNGLSFVLDNIEDDDPLSFLKLDEPMVDYTSISSIGYNDGFNQGIYYVRSFQTNSINGEQLSIIIDKLYGKALGRREKKLQEDNLFIQYEKGFINGREDVLNRYKTNSDNFSVIPDLDDNNITSIGYFDSYCYYLNYLLNEVEKDVELDKVPDLGDDSIAISLFKEALKRYKVEESKQITK